MNPCSHLEYIQEDLKLFIQNCKCRAAEGSSFFWEIRNGTYGIPLTQEDGLAYVFSVVVSCHLYRNIHFPLYLHMARASLYLHCKCVPLSTWHTCVPLSTSYVSLYLHGMCFPFRVVCVFCFFVYKLGLSWYQKGGGTLGVLFSQV